MPLAWLVRSEQSTRPLGCRVSARTLSIRPILHGVYVGTLQRNAPKVRGILQPFVGILQKVTMIFVGTIQVPLVATGESAPW